MRGIGVIEFGGPEALRVVDLPEVHAGRGEVRIRVQAAGVTPGVAAMSKLRANLKLFGVLGLGIVLAEPLNAQSIQITDRSLLVPGDTIEVVAGTRYDAGGLHRWFFGHARRAVWNEPVRIQVLDLDAYAGGITAFRTGGFGQSPDARWSAAGHGGCS